MVFTTAWVGGAGKVETVADSGAADCVTSVLLADWPMPLPDGSSTVSRRVTVTLSVSEALAGSGSCSVFTATLDADRASLRRGADGGSGSTVRDRAIFTASSRSGLADWGSLAGDVFKRDGGNISASPTDRHQVHSAHP